MAQAMKELGLIPDVVLVSSARRTLQTLEAFRPFEDGALVEPILVGDLASVRLARCAFLQVGIGADQLA
jgi:hypothetical protein